MNQRAPALEVVLQPSGPPGQDATRTPQANRTRGPDPSTQPEYPRKPEPLTPRPVRPSVAIETRTLVLPNGGQAPIQLDYRGSSHIALMNTHDYYGVRHALSLNSLDIIVIFALLWSASTAWPANPNLSRSLPQGTRRSTSWCRWGET